MHSRLGKTPKFDVPYSVAGTGTDAVLHWPGTIVLYCNILYCTMRFYTCLATPLYYHCFMITTSFEAWLWGGLCQ